MTFRARDLDKLVAFADHADIVNGTRIVEQLRAYDTQLSTFMYYGNFFVGKLLEIKHFGKGTFTDVGTTYKLLRRDILAGLLPQLDPTINLEFNAYFMDRVLQLDYLMVECPITFHQRVGVSKGGNASNCPRLRGRHADDRRAVHQLADQGVAPAACARAFGQHEHLAGERPPGRAQVERHQEGQPADPALDGERQEARHALDHAEAERFQPVGQRHVGEDGAVGVVVEVASGLPGGSSAARGRSRPPGRSTRSTCRPIASRSGQSKCSRKLLAKTKSTDASGSDARKARASAFTASTPAAAWAGRRDRPDRRQCAARPGLG